MYGGARLTWSNHRTPPALSRLGKFLIASDWLDLFPEVYQIALPKPTSDHCPILLETKCERWGPTPFRFELMWLEEKQFVEHIKVWWKNIEVDGCAEIRLLLKLKKLKEEIKEWTRNHFEEGGILSSH